MSRMADPSFAPANRFRTRGLDAAHTRFVPGRVLLCYLAATRRAISSIIVAPRRTFSTDIRSLLPWMVPSSSNGMTTGVKP